MVGAKHRDPWRWGFGLAIGLALTVGIVSIVEVQRARQEATALALTADRSTFLVGDLGRWVGRLRTVALDQLLRPRRDMEAEAQEIAAIDVALDRTVRELEPLLQPRERAAWRSFLRVLGRFRGEIGRAFDAIRGDRPLWARAVLVHRVPRRAALVDERLEELGVLNVQESRTLIAALDRRLARTRAIEAFLGGTLAVALLGISWAVGRIIRRQREDLDRYVARIVASNEDLDAFAGRIAHDVRNAVAPLGLASMALRRSALRPENVLRVADQLDRAVQSTQTLLDGLLAFSRAEGSGEPVRVRVRGAVEEALDELQPVAERIGARIDVQVEEAEVDCAAGLLHIVLVNLLGNALKFLAGQSERRVRVAARTIDGWCEIMVEDSGPGIPRDALGRIFEPFYRVTGAGVPGAGIGLATVRRVALARGGSVAVESDPGRGAVFRVRLPLADARSSALEEPGVAAAWEAGP
jgi:signal transduction histidine kinase